RDKLVTGVQTCALPILKFSVTVILSPLMPAVPVTVPVLTSMLITRPELPVFCATETESSLHPVAATELILKSVEGSSADCVPPRSEERRVGKECRDREE